MTPYVAGDPWYQIFELLNLFRGNPINVFSLHIGNAL